MALPFFGRKKELTPGLSVQEIPLTAIVPNRFQPRKVFTEAAITELAETIKAHGLLQPIILREYAPQQYEIVAGERRFRAMQYLQMAKAPAIVQKMSDEESAAMALIENLQREGLSAIEEAQAYTALMELNHLTQAQLAAQLGKSQSFVANKLRLLKLSEPVQQAIMNGEISERHGRELLRVDDYHQQLLLHEILASGLTVKETQQAAEAILHPELAQAAAEPPKAQASPSKPAKKRRTPHSHDTRMAINTLKKSVHLIKDAGMQVKMTEEDAADAYRIVIELPKK
ncbi:nucleoid occlusion protein [Lacticaseibacillus baoqingensis]|uniref:Nucleoid occlusion protein n=1 Tax=Lacticaseibacillus baoqingensis TaxID=2486013 RepID=A0ABW4E804_9LACO|nr:nucleoid occlusion protein [Lacticaseibacillus baoqingensis]